MSIYCVYLTTYLGKKLPMFYIGSTTVKKVKNGYCGSVSSKEYGRIWKEEFKTNPELFRTIIISTHEHRTDAFDKEEKLQKHLNVIQNPLYVNKSFANAKFSLKQHSPWTREKYKSRTPWNKGKSGIYSEKSRSKMGRKKGSPGIPCTETTKEKLRVPNPKKALFGERNGMFGKTHSDENKIAQSARAYTQFNGKSYEELYGKEKAGQLKTLRSTQLKGKDNSRENNPMFGRKHPDSAKELQSLRAKNRAKSECPHCKQLFAPSPMSRYHGDKCKDKLV